MSLIMKWLISWRVSFPRMLMTLLYGLLALQTAALLIMVAWTAGDQRHTMEQAMRRTNAQLINYLDSTMAEVDTYTKYYLTDGEFQRIINKPLMNEHEPEYASAQVYVKGLMRRHITLSVNIVGVTAYTSSGQLYDTTGGSADYLNCLEGIRADMEAQGRETHESGPVNVSIHRRFMPVMMLTQRLKNLYTGETIGFIHYAIGVKQLMDRLLLETSGSVNSLNALLVANGDIVYSNSDIRPSGEQAYALDKGEAAFTVRMNDKEKYLLLSQWSERHQMHIIQCEQYDRLMISILDAILLIVLLNICLLAIYALVFRVMTRMARQDFSYVEEFIRKSDRNAALPAEPMFFKETSALLKAYQSVSARLYDTQERETRTLFMKNEMETRYLEAQINPHFIYNSLNLISSLALLDGNANIHSMASNMARLLYYNLKGNRVITVREEIMQVERYISIQNMRFPGRFEVSITLDDDMLNRSIRRFALQPIVENAMTHGIERAAGYLHLWISGEVNGRQCVITIENDGLPLEPERIREINERMYKNEYALNPEDGTAMGIGLINVHIRLKQEYGEYGWVLLEERLGGRGLRARVGFEAREA